MIALLGFIWAIFAFIEKLINPDVPLGYSSLIITISIFAGIQLIAIGMVGEYIGRIFLSQNKKPQFSITKRFE